MSVAINDGFKQTLATGGETTIDFDFRIEESTDIRVLKTAVDNTLTELVNPTHYTVPGGSIGVDGGGVINLVTPAVAGEKYTCISNYSETRSTNFTLLGGFQSEELNKQLDRLTRIDQQLRRDINKTVNLREDSTVTGVTIPNPVASNLIGWNSSATEMVNYEIADVSASLDATFTSLSANQVATYNGTNWVNRSILSSLGTNIASAGTTNISAADSDFVTVTGTTTITSFGTPATFSRKHIWVVFSGVLTLTHNATSLILPGGASITTAAGDVAECVHISGANWRVVTYQKADGLPVIEPSSTPVGSISGYAGSSAPSGWLLCYGQAISRTTYASLFSALGTTYGSGDGSTTFNIPDLRGRVIAGVDNMGGSAANRITAAGSGITGTTLGAAGGTQTHTLTVSEMPSHSHEQRGGTTGTGGMRYETTNASATLTNSGIQTNSSGSGSAHQNTQPTMMLNYIIKH